ncbi:FecR family protein [Chitinophaga sp. Hz27]|uniref:FecR family protein n=1 Tax=Chitinophaga sp. Hz27 TaxID=3347169 RepID=UPI0035E1B783
MNIIQLRKIINSYLSGKAASKEKQLIDQYLQQAWENRQAPDDTEIQRLLVLDNLRNAMRPRMYIRWISAAAASLLLLVTAGTAWHYSEELEEWVHPIPMKQVYVAKYRVQKIMLPDSSVAILNGGTLIEYPATFHGKHRTVKVNGEAYFDVVPDKHPFVINGPNLRVTVLGTSFILTDSMQTTKPAVSVKTGKVAVSVASITQQVGAAEELVYDLQKNQINLIRQQEIDMDWITKSMVFDDNTLQEVFTTIEHVYHVNISCDNDNIRHQRFTGAFESTDTLEDMLRVLSVSYRLHLTKHNNSIVIR